MKTRYLITGGAGFIGTNVANHYLTRSCDVTIFDNFSRPGTEENVRWLRERHGDRLTVVRGDVRCGSAELCELVETADVVFHLAAQATVTRSVTNPREDFEINAFGTFNVLEAVRLSSAKPIVVYSSTNKVYGKLADVEVRENGLRYCYSGLSAGVPEGQPLDFYSPYGCSKGAGDQYVIDYARIYGLKTVVFRQSCIYGPHQFGIEDQGWVAWFGIRALQDLSIAIYGDGKQVRDVLFIEDLIEAYDKAIDAISRTAGQAYNIGGGPSNTLSLLELIELLQEHLGRRVGYSLHDWRPGDQLVFVSDVRKAKRDFGWEPKTNVQNGVESLLDWLKRHESAICETLSLV